MCALYKFQVHNLLIRTHTHTVAVTGNFSFLTFATTYDALHISLVVCNLASLAGRTCDKATFIWEQKKNNWYCSRCLHRRLAFRGVHLYEQRKNIYIRISLHYIHWIIFSSMCALSMKYDWKHIWFVCLLIGIKRSLVHWKISFVSESMSHVQLETECNASHLIASNH